MPATLSPQIAATLADAVYNVRLEPDVRRAVLMDYADQRALSATDDDSARAASDLVTEIADEFELQTRAVSGLSGVIGTRKESGYAMVLHGRGRRRGEVAVVFRGTQTAVDWLSNANYRGTSGPFGGMVHTGFYDIFRSMEREVMRQVQAADPSHLHVVGHSLGGAIGHLFAGRCAERNLATVELYSFGAPRSGADHFVGSLSRLIGAQNMRRVFAQNDPVPMVPIWPYIHAPLAGDGLQVAGRSGIISFDAHLMPHYIQQVANLDWTRLASAYTPPQQQTLREMLDEARRQSIFPLSSLALRALEIILLMAGVTVAATVATGVTLVDMMARALVQVATVSAEYAGYAMEIIRLAARVVGLRLAAGLRELSIQLVSFVLDMLFRAIANVARRALDEVGRLR